ncbi:SRRM2 protein homolog rsr-2 [Anabrus simplex]|uniref:SRRM2 protein homolog rsr-2 n=1 Tax=Anabrus simplex TaxID=316456 RepID=UPI0035A3968D
MVMSPIRPRFTPRHGFVCSTPVRNPQNSIFYASALLSPIFDEGERPSREKIPQRDRTSSKHNHGERMRNSSERIWQNLVASAVPQNTVILAKHKEQVHHAYQKGSKVKRMKEDDKYVSQNIRKGKEEGLVHKERLQRKGTFANSIEHKRGTEELEEMRSPKKKQTRQNSIGRNKESPHRKRLSTNSEKSSGKEDQELETVDSLHNIVVPKNDKVQAEATRSPQKKETLRKREKRNGKQQVVRECPQRRQPSRNSEKSGREEERKSVSESLWEGDILHNNTSQKETLQNSMDRNEKQEVVQQKLLKKHSTPDSAKSNAEKKTEASDRSTERNQQIISKIPRRKEVPQNCRSSKRKENSQAVQESPGKKHTSQISIISKRKEDTENMTEKHRRKRTSQNSNRPKINEDLQPVRGRLRKKQASPNMLSKGKKHPQALVKSQKKEVSQSRMTRSRRKEETISSDEEASQGSITDEGRNEPQIEDKTSQPSEELIKPKSKKNTLPEGPVSKSEQKRVVQGPSQRKEESRNNSKQNTKPQMSNAEKENIPLPESSSRGEKTKRFNTSSTSTQKASHPTYKTVRKRRQRAIESLAKFLTRGRLSTEYNPFRNGQKLIAPSEDDGNLRRSKRTRVKPLDYWRGERCLYKPTNHGPDFFRISSPV